MIIGFASKVASELYNGVNNKRTRQLPRELHSKTRRLLDQLNAAPTIDFLRIPPGNHLEKLSGELKEYWSIRINDQWRVIFRWLQNSATDIDIIDYH